MSNIFDSRVSADITAAEKATVISSLETIETTLPWMIGLTVSERISLPKIEAVNRDFVSDALDIIVQNPNLFPGYFNVAELEKDFGLYNELNEIVPVAERVINKLKDTQMKAGSEAFVVSLTAYRMLRSAAKDGVPGTQALYDRLKVRFANQGGPGENEEENPTPPTP